MATSTPKIWDNEHTRSTDTISRPWVKPADVGYLFAFALSTGMQMLPTALRLDAIERASRWAGVLWQRTNSGSVRRVRHHLRVLFGFQEGEPPLEQAICDHLALSIWNALVLNLLPVLPDSALMQLVDFEGLTLLEQQADNHKPMLLLGAHYGVYGYAVAAALAARGYPTSLLGYGGSTTPPPHTSRLYNRLYWPRVQRLNQRVRMTTITPGHWSQSDLDDILDEGVRYFYLLPDQYFLPTQRAPHLCCQELLGYVVYLDLTAWQTLKAAQVRSCLALPAPQKSGRQVVIAPFSWTKGESIEPDVEHYLHQLEAQLRTYPALWRDLRRPDLLTRLGHTR